MVVVQKTIIEPLNDLGDLKVHLVPTPSHRQEHLPLEYVTQKPVQPGLEHFLGQGIHNYKYLKSGCEENGARLFAVVSSGRTRSNGHKLKYKNLHLNMTKNFFTLRVAEHWNSLPREGMTSSLDTFKTHLDTFQCNLL
ncbi:hypothetical protein BTVI_59520 [Pitangus sulphuratus]|nr:hypothetical protein BTVI_59520 [Pitangus sulphuratus]